MIDLARCLQKQNKSVDLAFTADSVFTINDNGDVNKVPSNIKLNLNSYVIPTAAWLLLPFPFGQENYRESDGSLDGILNIGLPFEQPGAVAHCNAFYDLAGDDEVPGHFQFPEMILDVTLAVLKGQSNDDIFQLAENELQIMANQVPVPIDLESTNFKKTLEPVTAGVRSGAETVRLQQAKIDDLREVMNKLEYQRLSSF